MASYTISGNNKTTFAGTAALPGEAKVGTTYNGYEGAVCVTRYRFTTDGQGAAALSFQTTNATADIKGSSSSDEGVGRVRFALSTDPEAYVNYKGSRGSAAAGSYGNYVKGSLSGKLLPNTVYYLWLFPAGNFPGTTRFELGNCSLSTSGSYGVPSSVSVSNGSFGSAVPITLSNSVSGVTHTVKVVCGGITRILASKSSALSFRWTPSLSEYGPAIPDAKSAPATVTVTTYYGETSWGSVSKTISMRFPADAAPTVSAAALSCDNAAEAALAAFTVYVQGYSRVRSEISGEARYGATVSSYGLSVGGAAVSGGTGVLTAGPVTASGTVPVTLSVTDSRGFTASVQRSISVEPYARPALSGVSLERCGADGEADPGGTYLAARATARIAPLAGENRCTMTVAFKSADAAAYGAETPMTDGETVLVPGLDPDRTYLARITLTDALGNSASAAATLPTRRWAMKFSADGNAVGFGKAPEGDKMLEIPHDWSLTRKDQAGTATAHAVFTDELSALLLERIYPVGSLYMSTSAASPQSFLGGTWQRITGRFLLCATDGGSSGASQAAGRTGGEAAHTLTADELPAHTHTIPYTTYATATTGTNRRFAAYAGSTVSTGSAGGGGAHNNMPPYLAVYVWKRTA